MPDAGEGARAFDHPLIAIVRGGVAAVAGFGLGAALTVLGWASAAVGATLAAVLFASVYIAWRPLGRLVHTALVGARHGGVDATWLARCAFDVGIASLGAYTVFNVAVGPLGS